MAAGGFSRRERLGKMTLACEVRHTRSVTRTVHTEGSAVDRFGRTSAGWEGTSVRTSVAAGREVSGDGVAE
jgi:hypothetical protein